MDQHRTSALQQATSLLESSPLRLALPRPAEEHAPTDEAPVATQLEKELELAIKREDAATTTSAEATSKLATSNKVNRERRNYATINNGVYYWSMPSVLLDYLHKNDPALGERVVASQQAYARFKTYEPQPSPGDVETLISFGSRLQEVYYGVEHASAFVNEHRATLKDVLEQCASIYKEAHDVGIMVNSSNATLGKILFSWAVVLSDLARLVEDASGSNGSNEEKLEYAVASCLKYSGVVSMQEGNVQALNNWGLVICDLANYYKGNEGDSVTTTRKQLYRLAMSRFRQALRRSGSQESGVDRKVLARCSYNMGSVMYQYCSMNSEATNAEDDIRVAHAAQYVLLAYALNPSSEVFQKAVRSIQQFLPLPFMRFSKLVYVYDETKETDQVQQWRPKSLALDGYHLKTVEVHSSEVTDLEISVQDVTSCTVCVDPWIPSGVGVKIRHRGSRHCVYLSSAAEEDLQGLQDALSLLRVCSSSGLQALADVLQRRKK